MNPMITLADIREIKSISLNLNSDKELLPHILEAQDFDLRPLLGDNFYFALYNDFNSSPSLDLYSDLWNGCQYEFNNETFAHSGLKTVLIYHTYARYLPSSIVQSTPTGFVQKTNQYSEKIDDKTISRLIAQARSGATINESRVLDFISRNISDYPLFKGCKSNNQYKKGMKIRQIG